MIADDWPRSGQVRSRGRFYGPRVDVEQVRGCRRSLHAGSWTIHGTKLVADLGLRCQVCARLRFGSQGQYRSAFSRLFGTRRRYPWDPRAVSDPWLVEEEFGHQRTPTANVTA